MNSIPSVDNRWQWPLGLRASILLVLLPIFLVAGGFLTYDNLLRVRSDMMVGAHTQEVLGTSAQLLSAFQDAETGERGYLLTGRAEFLEPYTEGIARYRAYFERLKELTRDDAEQQQRLVALLPILEAKRSILAETLGVFASGDVQRARDMVAQGHGKRNMVEIRHRIAELEAAESRLLADSVRNSQIHFQFAIVLAGITALTSVVLVFLFVPASLADLQAKQALYSALRQGEKKLQASTRMLNAVLQNSEEAIYVKDRETRFLFVNAPAARLLLATPTASSYDLVGLSSAEVNRDASHASTVAQSDQRVMSTGEAEHVEETIESEQGPRYLLSMKAPMRDEHGKIVGLVGISHDITERKRTEQLLMEQHGVLELIASDRSLEECLIAVTAAIGRLSSDTRACILLADAQRNRFAAAYSAHLPPSFGRGLEETSIDERTTGPCGAAVYGGKRVACIDIAHDRRWAATPWSEHCLAHGVLAVYSEPVSGPDGTASGAVVLCFAESRDANDWQQRIAAFAAHTTSIAMQRASSLAALGYSEARFRAAQETSIDGFMVLDSIRDATGYITDFRWVYINEAAARIVGKPREWFLGRGLLAEMPGNEEGRLFDGYVDVVEKGNTWTKELEYRREGVDLYLRVVATKLGDGIGVSLADFTERRRSEKQVRRSDENFRAAVKAVEGVMWTNSAAGEMLGEQPGWAALTGQKYDEYQGFGWAAAVHPDDRQATITAWQAAIGTRSSFVFEHRVRRHDGQWRTCSIRAIPLFDAGGHILEWVGVHTDVTAMRALERERAHLLEAERAARSEAEGANRLKDEFLATLSHELRTPLSVIVGWSQLLRRKFAAQSEELAKGLKLIGDNAISQARIITDLLDMSRMAAGKMALEVKPLDLSDTIAQCVTGQLPLAQENGVTMTFDTNVPPCIVLADAARLQQVMGNLLTNALKFTPRGGAVRVGIRQAAAGFEILVADTGEGIAPDFLPHIFDRFRQADGSRVRQHGGLGLGLAIVQQLTQMHGGHVRAESEGVGRGARFIVWLPEAPGAEPTVSMDKFSDSDSWIFTPDALEAQSLKGLRVLAVEDQPDMLEQLARVLEERGAQVTSAHSAREALDAIARNNDKFHILVSDIGMPGMDGLELIRALRQDLDLGPERLAAVAVTAFTRPEDKVSCLEAGFQAHLSKPYDASRLVTLVRELTRSGSAQHEPVNIERRAV